VREGKFQEITRIAHKFAQIVGECRAAHATS
jgi:hypothetical protein